LKKEKELKYTNKENRVESTKTDSGPQLSVQLLSSGKIKAGFWGDGISWAVLTSMCPYYESLVQFIKLDHRI